MISIGGGRTILQVWNGCFFFFVPMFFWVDWELEKRFFWRMLGCFGLGVAEEYHRVPANNTWSDCWHTNMNNQNMICLMLISGIHWMLNILLWPSSNYDTLWNRNSYYQLQLNGYSQQKPVDSLQFVMATPPCTSHLEMFPCHPGHNFRQPKLGYLDPSTERLKPWTGWKYSMDGTFEKE